MSRTKVRRQPTVQLCEWYAMCANEAIGAAPHPLMSSVPVCERCRAKHDLALIAAAPVAL